MGRSKLTEADKEEIRKLSKEGYSGVALAAKYDVSRQTIQRVLNPDYYAKTLEQAKEYQKENGKRIRRHRTNTRRDYYLSFNVVQDASVVKQLDKQENLNDYIRNLVTDDINNSQQSE